MNMVLLFEDDFISPEKVSVSGRRAEHILSVHKAEKNKILTVGLLNGKMGKGTVAEIADNKIVMDVKLDIAPPEPLPLTLILALPRPKSFRKALHSATSMGIKKIIIIETWKVDKSYWKSPILETENIRDEIFLALEQAKDTVMPEVIFKRRFKPFIEDDAPALTEGIEKLIADPYATGLCPFNLKSPSSLAIGPEGGFTDYELKAFQNIGFKSVSIGARVLRVEFALAALTGRLFNI
jgi:RsmE family RNA methyltransferase